MRKSIMGRFSVIATLAAMMLGIGVTSASATGGPPHNFYGWHLQNVGWGWCLDSDANGNVYSNPCQHANLYQEWNVVGSGSSWQIQDVATNRCLEVFTSQYDGYNYLKTVSCNYTDDRQIWAWWPGDIAAQFQHQNIPEGCLDGAWNGPHLTPVDGSQIGTCVSGNKYQNWTAINP